MTIIKSQGHSLAIVGLDLWNPVFRHGQFYVGVSRATNESRVEVLLKATRKTENIVYKDVLLRLS